MSPTQIKQMLARAQAATRAAFRGVLGQLDVSKPVQLANIDGLAGEAIEGLELLQQFGFTSAPPAGTTVIALPLGGRTSASVIVATEHGAYRLKLTAAGEAALYNQDGDHVWLKRNGHVHIKASMQVEIETPNVLMHQNLAVGGSITAGGAIAANGSITDQADSGGVTMEAMRAAYNGHTHGSSPTPTPSM
jgi:phage gp45-like